MYPLALPARLDARHVAVDVVVGVPREVALVVVVGDVGQVEIGDVTLAVEDVLQALAVDGCATRELGDTDAARVPRLLHPYDDQLRVIHPLNRLPSVRLFCVPKSSTTPD